MAENLDDDLHSAAAAVAQAILSRDSSAHRLRGGNLQQDVLSNNNNVASVSNIKFVIAQDG